jgi:hypothetical protein
MRSATVTARDVFVVELGETLEPEVPELEKALMVAALVLRMANFLAFV